MNKQLFPKRDYVSPLILVEVTLPQNVYASSIVLEEITEENIEW